MHLHAEQRQQQPSRTGPRRPAEAPAARLQQLQRTAGNRAVGALLQRYEAGEHAQMGAAGTVSVNGVSMTQGEVNAMGDFFTTSDQMTAADPAELTTLRDLIRRDQDARTGKPGVTPVTTAEWETATKGRYLRLAAENRAHFAPPAGTSGRVGDNHKARWYDLHRQAMFQAWFDGRFNGHTVSNASRTMNAFCAHFLSDAFSAGHLVHKATITTFARAHFDATATTGLLFKENSFTKGVAAAVLADSTAGPKLRAHELKLVSWGDVTPQRFSEFLWQFAGKDPDKFFNAFARTIHDHLDDAVKTPGGGVEVTNQRGDTPWRLSGDATLALSPTTLKVATEAAQMADQNLVLASRATAEPDYPGLSDAVWALTPVPTKDGAALIQDTVDKIGDAAQPQAVRAFADLAVAEVDTVVAELIAAGHMRHK